MVESNTGPGGIAVDRVKEMMLYDALPAELRSLVGQLPTNEWVEGVWLVWQKFGQEARALIIAEMRKQYPEWRPEGE